MSTIDVVRERAPLVHCITNYVVVNFVANGLLAAGAAPVMAHAHTEVGDMAGIADALYLNIGTLDPAQVEAMRLAAVAASEKGIPVVLDPVGAGATRYRTETALALLEEFRITCLRGNGGEIAALLGETAQVRGVEGSTTADPTTLAAKAALHFGTLVAVTGPVDIVSDGRQHIEIDLGHPWMSRVSGTGCLLSAVVAAFLAVAPENRLKATGNALAYFAAAGEEAHRRAQDLGLGAFAGAFLDALSMIDHGHLGHVLKVDA